MSNVFLCIMCYRAGNCKQFTAFKHCDVGLRQRTYHVLSGSVLLVWGIIEHTFQATAHGSNHVPKMQVVRVRYGDERIVGVLIPNHCIEMLRENLESGAVSSSYSSEPMESGLTEFEEKLLDSGEAGENFGGY